MDSKITTSLLLDFYGQLLSEKQLEIMNYYYNDDLSLREISDMVGITRQGVHDTIKRSEAFLEDLENKLGLYAKWQYVEEQLELIDSAVCNIYSENREDCHSVGIFSECNNAQEAIINIRKRF
ncbi:MAG: sigma factor-like helix-turn-helix DNA-binding protein [Acutalibacteraceae bacterium]|nr:sigma factor-like helix-turn-helix DNA-binding protein [Acutalibacteraceae bacterium]